MKHYAGPEHWYEGDECPLSSDSAHVRSYDHSWCAVSAIKRTPSTPSRVYAQCIHGHKYPLRRRLHGDGNPGQDA